MAKISFSGKISVEHEGVRYTADYRVNGESITVSGPLGCVSEMLKGQPAAERAHDLLHSIVVRQPKGE